MECFLPARMVAECSALLGLHEVAGAVGTLPFHSQKTEAGSGTYTLTQQEE
jgi:hypothetical protein